MAWSIELAPGAHKGLKGLDPGGVRRLLSFLHERVAPLEDPRCIGEAQKGSELGAFWKYRVGDYRLICRIEDGRLLILVVQIGNRREIYR
jgi:mRNA interferase RelE/StbE